MDKQRLSSLRPAGRILLVLTLLGIWRGLAAPRAARAEEIEWMRQFGGTAPANDMAQATDTEGNLYVVGYTSGAMPGQSRAGGVYDAFVRKYDPAGVELWTRQFGTTGDDRASGVAADASGVYVVGYASGPLPGGVHAGLKDVFVRNYDPNGAELWTRQFGTPADDSPGG